MTVQEENFQTAFNNRQKMDQGKIKEYYNSGIERNRLDVDYSKLEGIRTKEIISRFLSPISLNIVDIGGGAGFIHFGFNHWGIV